MGNRQTVALFATAMAFFHAEASFAARLKVEPVLLELTAPAASGSLTLRNDEDTDIVVQTRVMRWVQVDGKERLESTTDVVASPPAVKLAPRADYVVRVVRVSKEPVRGEESYRVIVDQLPNAVRQRTSAINLMIRHSIPVFFRSPQLSPSRVEWSLAHDGDKLVVITNNSGDERLRIASMRLRDASGMMISFGNGLVGYTLARSSMSWTAPSKPRGFGASGIVAISAETDKGPINTTARLYGRQ